MKNEKKKLSGKKIGLNKFVLHGVQKKYKIDSYGNNIGDLCLGHYEYGIRQGIFKKWDNGTGTLISEKKGKRDIISRIDRTIFVSPSHHVLNQKLLCVGKIFNLITKECPVGQHAARYDQLQYCRPQPDFFWACTLANG